MSAPRYEDVVAASRRLHGQARLTPLMVSTVLNEIAGGTVLIKAENLQVAGAFKFRGAYNRLVQLDDSQRKSGVVAWSSGNHAQGVAAAGRYLGVRTTIVMPSDAPKIKIENTQRLGAEIVFYDRHAESREEIGHRLSAERGATLVPSYDDPHIIAGQGTVALEMVTQARELYGATLDAALIPCGGGGLIAGCALALKHMSPEMNIFSVEPAEYDDTARSLAADRRETAPKDAHTLCDALMAPTPGEITFEINRRLLCGGLSVSDDMVLAAMAFAWRELKLVVEPGGAVALAAVLFRRFDCGAKTVGIVLSGGNVDAEIYARALGAPSIDWRNESLSAAK